VNEYESSLKSHHLSFHPPRSPLSKRPFHALGSENINSLVQPKTPRPDIELEDSFIGMQGNNIVYELLLRHNVEYVFGYNGATIVRLMDIMCSSDCIKFIVPRHEQGAGFMAEGYARST
jgi:acetolactate synthase-1/2/3 large subunit